MWRRRAKSWRINPPGFTQQRQATDSKEANPRVGLFLSGFLRTGSAQQRIKAVRVEQQLRLQQYQQQ